MRTFLCGCEHVKMRNRCSSCPHGRTSLAGGCKAHVCWELLHNNCFPFLHSLLVKLSEACFLLETWLCGLAGVARAELTAQQFVPVERYTQ